MATRNIVPRVTGEGSIGTTVKRWLDGFFDSLHVTGTLSCDTLASSGPVDLTINNELTGNMIKARDHAVPSSPEVGNIIYGPSDPPAADTTPIGTFFIKYVP